MAAEWDGGVLVYGRESCALSVLLPGSGAADQGDGREALDVGRPVSWSSVSHLRLLQGDGSNHISYDGFAAHTVGQTKHIALQAMQGKYFCNTVLHGAFNLSRFPFMSATLPFKSKDMYF